MSPRYLLDTDICIYIRQQRPAEVLRRFRRLKPGEAAISTITYGELLYGAERNRERDRALERLEALAAEMSILALPPEAGPAYGAARAALAATGEMIGNNDLWIAAHAIAGGLTLVTNNMREFSRIEGLALENWVGAA